MSIPLYKAYKNACKGLEMPFLLLDKDVLDQNIQSILQRANGKPIRIATKSIRSIAIIKMILESSSQFIGVMSYSAAETLFLLENDIQNILIGYPITNESLLDQLCLKIAHGKAITFMVDRIEHVTMIDKAAKKVDIVAPICLDIDMSSKFPFIYFGVYRSHLKNLQDVQALLSQIKPYQHVKVEGLMGYEAQIAGIGDTASDNWLMNWIISILKKKSIRELKSRRMQCISYLRSMGCELKIINGGGTGSIESTIQEADINEITVGSGFYSSHLFDHYSSFKHLPALMYAVECTRKPAEHMITCSGGGYVASGAISSSKQAIPYLPKGLRLIDEEGTGEVQTPMDISKSEIALELGDPVFMRHSKAGEVCEHFNKIHVLINGENLLSVNTYRGVGKCFL